MYCHNHKSDAVVFVGGGFAGLTTALQLSRKKNRPSIILIEPRDRFVFTPLLYELLSAELNLWEVAPTYKSLVEDQGIVLIQEYVKIIDTQEQKVVTESGLEIEYAKVVIATGSNTNDFSIPGVFEFALKFHTLADVELLKKMINDLKNCKEKIHKLVIVGGGPTGIELACKLSDLLKNKVQIDLIESGTRLLPNAKSFNKEQAELALNKRQIGIYCQTEVTSITANKIEMQSVKDGNIVNLDCPYKGIIWTAGTRAVYPQIVPQPQFIDERLAIDSYLNVIGLDNILAIGDVSCNKGTPYPTTAQVAMQQAATAALNLEAAFKGKTQVVFEFQDFGEMLSLGIGEASITSLGLTIAGPLAFTFRRLSYFTKMPNFGLGIRSASAWLLNIANKKKFS